MDEQIDLVELIKANPGCVAVIDNDCWWLYRDKPENCPYEMDDHAEEWEKQNTLATYYNNIKHLGDGGYGSGNCYGGDILQAPALIVGIKVESV